CAASRPGRAGGSGRLARGGWRPALPHGGPGGQGPVHSFRLEVPADVCGPVLPVLGRLRATWRLPVLNGPTCLLEGEIPAGEVSGLGQLLPGLSRGEGVLESEFSRYQPVHGGPVPGRPRTR